MSATSTTTSARHLVQAAFALLFLRPFLALFIGVRVRGREHLPGRDPFEIGRLLRGRENLRRVPLLLLRGTFEAPDPSKTAPDHDGIVQKPFDSERLAAAVRDLIERKTEPSTLPEEPIFPAADDPRPTSLPEGPGSPAAAGPTDSLLREWIRKEIHGVEKDVEKRVRARVLADVKEWMAGDGQGKKEAS